MASSPSSSSSSSIPSNSSSIVINFNELKTKIAELSSNQDPIVKLFLKCYLYGQVTVLPSLFKILLNFISNKKTTKNFSDVKIKLLFRSLIRVLFKSFKPNSFPFAFAFTITGTKIGEKQLEPFIRILFLKYKNLIERNNVKGKTATEGISVEKKSIKEDRTIKILSTFISSTLSSLISISLLKSKKSNSNNQSTTIDLTLFLFVRAADSLIRLTYSQLKSNSPSFSSNSLSQKSLNLLTSQSSTLLFILSASRIIWCFFYQPKLLPKNYNLWIKNLARFDSRLLDLLQYARKGEYVYGVKPSEEVRIMSEGIAKSLGREAEFVNPYYIKRLDCSVVHGKLGAGSCEMNALKRWIIAFGDASLIYIPVHLLPQLIFNLPSLTSSPFPSTSLIKILTSSLQSSIFLASFISSIYYSVCFTRTRLAYLLQPFVKQQIWDSGLCIAFGSFMCGFTILLEDRKRRREMGLFCAGRALFTLLPLPNSSTSFLSKRKSKGSWIEKLVFSTSTGIIMSCMIHKPILVSGVVRGVLGKVMGDWNGKGKRNGK